MVLLATLRGDRDYNHASISQPGPFQRTVLLSEQEASALETLGNPAEVIGIAFKHTCGAGRGTLRAIQKLADLITPQIQRLWAWRGPRTNH
jgi:hypothetical protein